MIEHKHDFRRYGEGPGLRCTTAGCGKSPWDYINDDDDMTLRQRASRTWHRVVEFFERM